jgi:hypothetical protein
MIASIKLIGVECTLIRLIAHYLLVGNAALKVLIVAQCPQMSNADELHDFYDSLRIN